MSGEQLVHDALELLWGGDDRRISDIVDPDYRDHSALALDQGPPSFIAQRQALREAFADIELTPLDVIVNADHAVAHVRVRGLHVGPWAGVEPCRRSVEWDEIHIWRLRSGRLVEHWACRDDLAALTRLGAVVRWDVVR